MCQSPGTLASKSDLVISSAHGPSQLQAKKSQGQGTLGRWTVNKTKITRKHLTMITRFGEQHGHSHQEMDGSGPRHGRGDHGVVAARR